MQLGPMGPHEYPFSGVTRAQTSELRSKWERKLYSPRGTQVHLLAGKTSTHSHDSPNPSGLKAFFFWKALPNTSATPRMDWMCPGLLQGSLGSSLPGHKPHDIVMICFPLCLGTVNRRLCVPTTSPSAWQKEGASQMNK